MSSSFSGVFKKLDTPEQNITLGEDIKEFMNVFRLIHGDPGVISHGNITPTIKKIYDAAIEQNALSEDITTVSVDQFTMQAIPVMPEICFVKGDNQDLVVHLEFEDFELDESNTLTCTIKKTEEVIKNPKVQYYDVVKSEMMKFTSNNVYTLFTSPIKSLDDINKNNESSFSEKMKETDMYKSGKSFFDLLTNFAQRDVIGLDTAGAIPSEPAPQTDAQAEFDPIKFKLDSELYADVKDLHDILHMFDANNTDHLNKLVVDIMKTQTDIDDTKERVKQQRNKLYTYVSRDAEYSKKLTAERATFNIILVIFAVIIIAIAGILYTRKLPIRTKTTAIVALSSVVVFAHVVNKISGALTGKRRTVVEGFESQLTSMGFTDTTYDCPTVLANFIDKFGEVLSQEIKQEYFDTLHESQAKDLKILSQLEKEHNINSHFHQLKNNLSHFKINEIREYKKLAWNAIVITCMIAILYATKMNMTISRQFFNLATSLIVVTYITYCLLTVKGIMLRDRQDWDRFHWTVSKLNNREDNASCNALPGFQR